MKFKFQLDPVIHFRKRLEDEARREFQVAQYNLETCLRTINFMYQQIDQTRESILQSQTSESANVAFISQCEEFIEAQKKLIEKKRMEARELMSIMEQKQEVLVEKAKDHKVLLKLKEKRQKQFILAKKKREIKRIDDIVTMRFQPGEDS